MVQVILVIMLMLSGCTTVVSHDVPVIGDKTSAPYGWDNPVNGWCKRHRDDPNCP